MFKSRQHADTNHKSYYSSYGKWVLHFRKQLIAEPRFEQVMPLRANGVAIHHLAHKIRRHCTYTRILHNILCQFQRSGKNSLCRINQFREQVTGERIVSSVDGADDGLAALVDREGRFTSPIIDPRIRFLSHSQDYTRIGSPRCGVSIK
ncbi:hypothetical protein ABW21_db0204253 [Orbilia brochopaga]|nr:hypothetical protein ABW21_db0204253 [Drechslerella brochopaga]